MSKVEHHPLNEYVLLAHNGNIDSTQIAVIPVPQSGQIISITATEQVAQATADATITVEHSGVPCVFTHPGSAANTMVIAFTGSAQGKSDVAEFAPLNPINYALFPPLDTVPSLGGVIEIISDAGGDSGFVSFAIVIRT